jgi:hypothetical protein
MRLTRAMILGFSLISSKFGCDSAPHPDPALS